MSSQSVPSPDYRKSYRSLGSIVKSTVQPRLRNPAPVPSASPKRIQPTYHILNSLLAETPDHLAFYHPHYVSKLTNAVNSCSNDHEGVLIYVVYWSSSTKSPSVFPRVIHTGMQYCLGDDVDLLQHVEIWEVDMVLEYQQFNMFNLEFGEWGSMILKERIDVKPGSFVFITTEEIDFEEQAETGQPPYFAVLGGLIQLAKGVQNSASPMPYNPRINLFKPDRGRFQVDQDDRGRKGWDVTHVIDNDYSWVVYPFIVPSVHFPGAVAHSRSSPVPFGRKRAKRAHSEVEFIYLSDSNSD